MKKTLILAGAALLALAACNKSEVVTIETSNEMTFKAVASNVTKGAELTGTVMPNTYAIYAAATQKNANGNIENPRFFATTTEQLFGTDVATPVAETPWRAGAFDGASLAFVPAPIYWPLGGVKMDFLAYAMPQVDHNDIAVSDDAASDWTAFWNNASTDAASKLSFNGVDTYDNQVDVLYAVANDRTSANSGASDYVPMTFKHAQALLIFNIKKNDVNAELMVKEIAFYTPERVEAIRADQVAVAGGATAALAALADTDVTLKTVGTFTVDNTRNTLLADWTYGATWADSHKKENYAMPLGSTGDKSESNLADVLSDKVLYNTAIAYDASYAQLGETLLIPEQEKVNFTMTYTLGGNTYTYTYNDLRGVWEKGKKYIYNIDIDLQEIIITERVVDFDGAQTAIPLS